MPAAVSHLPSTADDIVVLVHGTFATRDSDEGDSWWQRGSAAWNGLKERLPLGVELPRQGRLFRWSGENSERDRIKAGGKLLAHLLKLESQGTRYHLVGHSHGGSVIWHALRLATLRKNLLAGLRSWSTVGTPFLYHRTRSIWHVMNVFKILLAIVLVRPAVRTLERIFELISAALFGTDHGVQLPSDGGTGFIAMERSLTTKFVDLCGIPVVESAEGLRIGSYDPSSGQTIVEYVFLTGEGWFILAVALFAAYVYLNLAVFCISPVLESLRIRREARFERRVMDAFQQRWLGLWSPDDEAINGLRATLELSVSFVSRMAPRESILVSDRINIISRPHRWLLAPIYNSMFRPFLDGVIRSQVLKSAQGNNRPAAEVVAVSPAPVEVEGLDHLPNWLCEKLTQEADQHARDMAPKLRELLAGPSFISGLQAFGNAISGRELVHTSYFDHPEVLGVLAMHIAWACDQEARVNHEDQRNVEMKSWMHAFKAHLNPQAGQANSTNIVRQRRAA